MVEQLLVERVAAWCEVSPNAVQQMLSRATDDRPFPPAHVLPVLLGASRAGLRFDVSILWPPFSEIRL